MNTKPYNKKAPICPKCFTLMLMDYSLKYQKLFYFCPNRKCDMAITAHSNREPTGIPANRKVRELRQYAHRLANQIWEYKNPLMQNKMYEWLGNNSKSWHIGKMEEEELREVIGKFKKIITKFNLK